MLLLRSYQKKEGTLILISGEGALNSRALRSPAIISLHAREKMFAGFPKQTPHPHPAKVLVACFTLQSCIEMSRMKFKSKEVHRG